MRGEQQWYGNYDRPELAERAAQRLNALAQAGCFVQQCSFYLFSVGAPRFLDDDPGATAGLYRERVARCRCCGHPLDHHEGRIAPQGPPCGGPSSAIREDYADVCAQI